MRRIYTGWDEFFFTDRLRRLKMYFTIPSCHGEGVPMNWRCHEKRGAQGQLLKITRIEESHRVYQHLQVLRVHLIELNFIPETIEFKNGALDSATPPLSDECPMSVGAFPFDPATSRKAEELSVRMMY